MEARSSTGNYATWGIRFSDANNQDVCSWDGSGFSWNHIDDIPEGEHIIGIYGTEAKGFQYMGNVGFITVNYSRD